MATRTDSPSRTSASSRTDSSARQFIIDLNKCITVNGGDSEKITFTSPASYAAANTTEFSIGAWIKVTSKIASEVFYNVFGFQYDRGRIYAFVDHSITNCNSSTSFGSILIGNWYRIIMTFKDADNTPKIYINGVNSTIAGTSKSGTRNATNATSAIGNSPADFIPFIGQIDEVCFWNKELTQEEITIDYITMEPPTTNLLTRFRLNESSGNVTDSVAGTVGSPTLVTQNVTSRPGGTRTVL